MRIRKNAKISPLVYAASSLKPGTVIQTHVCQLNQSPWDVMSFSPPSSPPPPPPSSQVNKTGASGIANSSTDSISVLEREKFDDSRGKWDYQHGGSAADKADGPTILCCKTDGRSWYCRKEAAAGSSMCEHHLSLSRSYNSSSHPTSKKQVVAPQAARRRSRPKKASGSSSNPYEFYYYSGFGPRWGKKRGGVRQENNGNETTNNVENENEMDPSPSSLMVEADFDYDDYDDEEEEEINGKKRARKPIKARSLKSLM